MAVPACDFGDLLLTDRTETTLFFPEVQEPSFSFERADHLHIKPFLEVGFPGRIIRVSLGTNFRVPLDTNRVSGEQAYHFDLPFFPLEDSCEHPPVRSRGWPVFVLDPPACFVAVSSLRPEPGGFEDFVINSMKNFPAYYMTVIQGPSTDLWIEFCDQFSCRQVPAFLDVFSDLCEKRLDILLRRSDEEFRSFPSLILAYGLSKKVKPLLDMRDDRFLR